METLSVPHIQYLANKNSPSSGLKYFINYLLYNKSKLIDRTSMLKRMLAILIKLLLNRVRISSLTINSPSSQINKLLLTNEPKIHSVKYLT